ncbi:MAG: hypothetical protein JW940_38185 [Polyangiaceae bacterium]|nr:hypothetical protein [Polyangiaceae bacterium]
MDGHRQRSGRRRRRKTRADAQERSEVVLIAARRPNAPVSVAARGRIGIAASASPHRAANVGTQATAARTSVSPSRPAPEPRRSARIIELHAGNSDDVERERQRLIERLLASEGRVAISRAADEYRAAGFAFPVEQEVQLKLLEHLDEECARAAIVALEALLDKERPIKKPVFEQRLRRLEEYADEPATREAAASLRRAIRW